MRGLAVALGVFAVCAVEAVTEVARPTEARAMLDLHAETGGTLTSVMRAASFTGTASFVAAVAVVVAVAAYRVAGRAAALTFVAVAVGGAFGDPLKLVFDRPRPHLYRWLTQVSSSSFPSGHATHSMALALALLVLLGPTARARGGVLLGAVLLVTVVYVGMVGCSRVYLGVHYPSDVVGGWSLAFAWGCVVLLVRTYLVHRRAATPR